MLLFLFCILLCGIFQNIICVATVVVPLDTLLRVAAPFCVALYLLLRLPTRFRAWQTFAVALGARDYKCVAVVRVVLALFFLRAFADDAMGGDMAATGRHARLFCVARRARMAERRNSPPPSYLLYPPSS